MIPKYSRPEIERRWLVDATHTPSLTNVSRRDIEDKYGSLDIYERPAYSSAFFEVEFESESAAAAYLPPAFVGEEVTGKAEYSGFSLAERAP